MILLLSIFSISLLSMLTLFAMKRRGMQENRGVSLEQESVSLEIPYVEEIKHLTKRKIKTYGYMTLVTAIRLYFRSSNLVKSSYAEMKDKMKNVKRPDILTTQGSSEVSRFLQTVSDYKHKIRKIKHQIKEEEKIK